MFQRNTLLLVCFLTVRCASAATITADAAGFANTTPGFWSVTLTGNPDEQIAAVTLILPSPGFFNLGTVPPVFDSVDSVGLSAGDVTFSYSGATPTLLQLSFAPNTFVSGDRLQFAADFDGYGSKIGGQVGGYGGALLTITLADGRTGSVAFRTNTSVDSNAPLTIGSAAVPEPVTSALIALSLPAIAFHTWRRRFRTRS